MTHVLWDYGFNVDVDVLYTTGNGVYRRMFIASLRLNGSTAIFKLLNRKLKKRFASCESAYYRDLRRLNTCL